MKFDIRTREDIAVHEDWKAERGLDQPPAITPHELANHGGEEYLIMNAGLNGDGYGQDDTIDGLWGGDGSGQGDYSYGAGDGFGGGYHHTGESFPGPSLESIAAT